MVINIDQAVTHKMKHGGENMKISIYVGSRSADGTLNDVRCWNDIAASEKQEISKKLQIQCANAIGYEIKKKEKKVG